MSRTVFVTGATGFIGSRLVARLSGRGDHVRCYLRGSSSAEKLGGARVEIVRGELTDEERLSAAMRGADVAYHVAGVYDIGVVDEAQMARVNVSGTRAFVHALGAAGVPRGVYVSTSLALGPVREGEGDETSVHDETFRSAYERTKTEAHRIALRAQRDGVPLVIVCPANVYGPGDEGPNGRFIEDLLAGRLPGLPLKPARFSYVHVDDVVEGLLRAGDAGRIGETYVLSGEKASITEFAQRVTALAGRRAPFLRFPTAMVVATGVVLDAITRVSGIRFPISAENARTASDGRWVHSHAKATRELDWRPRSLDEGLPATVQAFAARKSR